MQSLRQSDGAIVVMGRLNWLCLGELVFAYTANRADKILGQFLERCAGFNTCIGASFGGIILPTANITYILLHSVSFFKLVIIRYYFIIIIFPSIT